MADSDSLSTEIEVTCGTVVTAGDPQFVQGAVVDLDRDQADMCVLSLSNTEGEVHNAVKLGDEVEVKFQGTSVFKGEVVGLEPVFKLGAKSVCNVRAFNRLHRLLRGRKTRTFTNKTDSAIAKMIADECKLRVEVEDTKIPREHVWQHNQTDLELLRILAARNGFEVVVDGEVLYFRKPQTVPARTIEFRLKDPEKTSGGAGDWGGMSHFVPRLSSAGLVSAVEVRAWNPIEKKEIVQRSDAVSSSKLGKRVALANLPDVFGDKVTFTVDHPVVSPEEAKNLANARLGEILMTYITGDLLVDGQPGVKPGDVIYININPDQVDDRFNGLYRVVGVSHRYQLSKGKGDGGGGYQTGIRVERDAEGGEPPGGGGP